MEIEGRGRKDRGRGEGRGKGEWGRREKGEVVGLLGR